MTKHSHNEETEEQMIETIDEDGNVVNFELIDIIEMDGKEYGLLLPKEENENDDPNVEREVVLMRLTKEGEEYIFEMIEDDEEFNKVVDFIDTLEDIEEETSK